VFIIQFTSYFICHSYILRCLLLNWLFWNTNRHITCLFSSRYIYLKLLATYELTGLNWACCKITWILWKQIFITSANIHRGLKTPPHYFIISALKTAIMFYRNLNFRQAISVELLKRYWWLCWHALPVFFPLIYCVIHLAVLAFSPRLNKLLMQVIRVLDRCCIMPQIHWM